MNALNHTTSMRSKRLAIPLLWTTFVLALPALGQRPCRSGIGVKGGPLMSTTHAEGLEYDMVPGGTLGVYAPLWCGNRFELQPELLGTSLGSAFTDKEGSRHVLRMYYVQLPLTAKLFVSNAVNFQVGVQGSRLIAARTSDENGSDDATDLFRKFEFGLNTGLGVDLQSGVDLTLRYYSGMSGLSPDDQQNFATNRTLQFTLGLRMMRFRRMYAHRR
jgi:hypothetical protein